MSELLVRYEQRTVGHLWSESRVLHFRYAPTWCADPDAFPLSPWLPLSSDLMSGDSVLHFFSNLLPEGPVLNAILKLKRLPAGDVFAQLEAFGEDAAGAFSLSPADRPDAGAPGYRPYPVDAIRADIERMSHHLPLLLQHGELRLSLAGAQDKIPVKYADGQCWLPENGAASTHILKPAIKPEWEFPDAVWNEAFCLTLAAKCGLNVAAARVLELPEPVLLVERFDRRVERGTVRRLHQLDFCQLASTLPDLKYQKDGGPGLETVFALIDHHADVPGKARLQALDWLMFNYMIGNADAHGKNIAMLVGTGGKLSLAPAYDLLCTAIYPSLSDKLAMSIGGESRPKWVRADHWQRFTEAVGVNPGLLKRRATQLCQKAQASVTPACEALQLSPDVPVVQKITVVMDERARWLAARLG